MPVYAVCVCVRTCARVRRAATGIIGQVLFATEVGGNRLLFTKNMGLTKLTSLAFADQMLAESRLIAWFLGGYIHVLWLQLRSVW